MNSDYLAIVGSSLAVYAFMVLAIRLFGKKELSQLSVIDLVFILLISNCGAKCNGWDTITNITRPDL